MADLLQSLCGNDDLYNEIIKENLERRILVFNDEVNDAVLENYILYILKWNREDKDIPVDKRKKIMIYFNSCGGDVFSGFSFVDAIEASTTPIVGVAFGLVASMAYHILIACPERIAFNNSVLLQHDGNVNISSSGGKSKDVMKFFDKIDQRGKEHVLKHTKITAEYYDEIYDQEKYMHADEAKELGCIDKIIGVDCSLDEIL